MFAQKINSIESQIAQLTAQLDQYRTLEWQLDEALEVLAKIQASAVNLGVDAELQQKLLEAIGATPTPPHPTPSTDTSESETLEEEQDDWTSEEENTFDSKYSTPEELAAALENDDTETVLMEIANVLDCAPAVELQGQLWYFARNLPLELSDRILNYLPKSVIPEWRKQMEAIEQEARASLFPEPVAVPKTEEPQITVGTRVEIEKDGERGIVSWVGQNNNGDPVASVTVKGGTRGSIPVDELKPVEQNFSAEDVIALKSGEVVSILQVNHIGSKIMLLVRMPNGSPATIHPESVEKVISKVSDQQPEEEQASVETFIEGVSTEEIESLAKQCLQLRSWSQIRVCCDRNPQIIELMQQIARTKAEVRLINNLPSLILGYFDRTNDKSDLEWLPEKLLGEVEVLIQQAA